MEGRLVPDLEESIEKEACKLLAVDLKDHEKLEDFRKAIQEKFEGKLDLFFSNRQYQMCIRDRYLQEFWHSAG